MLRSRLFFDAANLGRRVSSPIEFAVGAVRALEMLDPPPSTPVLADWCGRLGQDLFYPPNVGGWPGGRAWITTRSAIGRANFAAALVEGESVGLGTPFDLIALADRHGQRRNPAFFAQLLLGTESLKVALDELGSARQALDSTSLAVARGADCESDVASPREVRHDEAHDDDSSPAACGIRP